MWVVGDKLGVMVKVIAHRGASAAARENTIEAFRLAAELGADWVELDARRTSDGHIVVNHDAELPDGRVICELTRSDLPSYICELHEALDAAAGLSVNIEIKNFPGDADFDETETVARQVVELVGQRGQQAGVLISCFHRPTIDLIRELDPAIATAMLGYQPTDAGLNDGDWAGWMDAIASGGHRAADLWYPVVDATVLNAAHAVGLEVNVWTVNDPADMAALIDAGVDGLCTDVPDVARAVLDELGL